jgi:molybdopterin molybdotransferase
VAPLLSVDDYRARVLSLVTTTEVISVGISDCLGYALAEDVVAPWSLPNFDNSSMDGYAVLATDVAGATADAPAALEVIGDIAAGFSTDTPVRPGTAIRIMTGAPMPPGATAVVPVERTDGSMGTVTIHEPVDDGAFIRRAGDDVTAGDVVVRAGTMITSRQIAVIAAIGAAQVRVHRRPRIGVLSTGSELVEPGTPLESGQIVDSNSFLLVAACVEAGADAERLPRVADDEEAFRAAIDAAARTCDLILTSGGVSMGAYDTVKAVLSTLGTVDFIKIAMQPGMPQGCGRVSVDNRTVPIVTLPGNPVSSYVSFENFVRPAIRTMLGADQIHRPERTATMTEGMQSPGSKRQYARGLLDRAQGTVTPVGGQGSHVVGGLALANCLIVIDEGVSAVAAGDSVRVIECGE